MEQNNLDELKERLTLLESKLKDLLSISNRDLEIAKRLQTLVVKNRLPSIPGLNLLARHIPGSDVSAEAFDIIPTKDFREIYVVTHWSESFGLSSVLLQAMVHLQSRAALESHPNLDTHQLYSEIKESLSEYDTASEFRLSVLHFDVHSLKYSLVCKGFLPWLVQQRGKWSSIEGTDFDSIDNEHLSPKANAKEFSYQGIIEPGSRLFFLSTEWNYQAKTIKDFIEPLQLKQSASNAPLLDTVNELLLKCEDKIRDEETRVDISALAIEVDSKKIHLA